MKNIIAIIVVAIVVNILAYLFVEAWDKECQIREQRQQKYFNMLLQERAANERR